MNSRLKFALPIILFGITIAYTFDNNFENASTAFFLMIAYLVYFIVIKRDDTTEETICPEEKTNNVKPPYLIYYGDELNFSDAELISILNKRFPYYYSLSAFKQEKFLERLKIFIPQKTFKIYDSKAYKEMPVLISASALQLTLGLKNYLLPNFEFIHVYPKEFMRTQETICFLEGNVSGHAINLSWKHFLEGYQNVTDGQNVGLHEFSHALYYQTFVIEENYDNNFKNTFPDFNNYGNKIFMQGQQSGLDLFSDYALRNFQEFWAESIEIFFEKPSQLKNLYPQLFNALKIILNQDPLNNQNIT